MGGPLEGIRALEWAVWLNGPAAGNMLGDLGAEVIKIERPGAGDPSRTATRVYNRDVTLPGGNSLEYEYPNRSKKSITLDLKQEKGRQVLYRLVEKADVFFTNFQRSIQARLGADYATLSRYNPKLIYAYNGGYGSLGPEGERRTFDSMIQARSGLMKTAGGEEWAVSCPTPLFDQMGATMLAYGILAALLARERQGVGQEIEVSIFNSAIQLLGYNVNWALWGGQPFSRITRLEADPLYNNYRCADGKWLRIGEADVELYWPEFCRALGIEELEKDPRIATPEARGRASREIIEILDRIFASRSREEWLRLFRERGCAFTYDSVNAVSDLAQDPQVIANEYFVDFPHPSLGRVKTTRAPVKFSQTPSRVPSAAPRLGEHTEEVLREVAGLTLKEINQLRAEGAI